MAAPTELLPDKHGVPRFKFRIQRIGLEIEGAWKPKPQPPPLTAVEIAAAVGPEVKPVYVTKTRMDGTTQRIITNGEAFNNYQRAVHDLIERRRVLLFPDNTQVKPDPSVKFPNTVGLAAIGEVVSEPMIRPALWVWMRDHYPDVTNRTCGIHVHMSLRHELDYQRLIDRTFHDHMLLGLHRWGLSQKLPKDHVFWPRIRGCNLFCQDVYHGDWQTMFKGGHGAYHDHRYGIVNYCWGVHRTLEIRVLPTFSDKKTAIRAVRRVLNLTEEYLAQRRQLTEVEHKQTVPMPAEPAVSWIETFNNFCIKAGHVTPLMDVADLTTTVFPAAAHAAAPDETFFHYDFHGYDEGREDINF